MQHFTAVKIGGGGRHYNYISIQYNSTSFLSNMEDNYITVIVEVVCLNMFL